MKFGKLLQSRTCADEMGNLGIGEHFLRYKALKKQLKALSGVRAFGDLRVAVVCQFRSAGCSVVLEVLRQSASISHAGDAGEAAVLSEAGAGAGGHDAHAVYSPAVLSALFWACGVQHSGTVPQEQACGLLVHCMISARGCSGAPYLPE